MTRSDFRFPATLPKNQYRRQNNCEHTSAAARPSVHLHQPPHRWKQPVEPENMNTTRFRPMNHGLYYTIYEFLRRSESGRLCLVIELRHLVFFFQVVVHVRSCIPRTFRIQFYVLEGRVRTWSVSACHPGARK